MAPNWVASLSSVTFLTKIGIAVILFALLMKYIAS